MHIFIQSCAPYQKQVEQTATIWFKNHLITQAQDSLTEISIDQFALTWLGTPYGWGANGPQKIDCSAFVLQVYKEAYNIQLPRTAQLQSKMGKYIEFEYAQKGDLLFFGDSPEQISHVGIYWGHGWFINATVSRGVIFSNILEPYWNARFRWAKRIW